MYEPCSGWPSAMDRSPTHGLVQLQDLTDLTSLVLGEAYYPDGAVNVTDQGLRHLAPLAKLESLEISSTKLTGAGLVHLKALTSLASLRLKCPLLSDRELPALASIKGIESLCVGAVPGRRAEASLRWQGVTAIVACIVARRLQHHRRSCSLYHPVSNAGRPRVGSHACD